jgi:hypothetical protein
MSNIVPAFDGSSFETSAPAVSRRIVDDYEAWVDEVHVGLNGWALTKPFAECSNSECEREAEKRGMCERHYRRWAKEFRDAGLSLPPSPPRPTWSADLTGDRPYDKQYREVTKHRLISNSAVDPESGCWLWQKGLDRDGYGICGAPTRNSAHRVSYLVFVGSIPEGMVVDHRCHNEDKSCPGAGDCRHRRCINPGHLVVATNAQNILRGQTFVARNKRKTHCVHGHEFTSENTLLKGRRRWRICRTCRRIDAARRQAKKRSSR